MLQGDSPMVAVKEFQDFHNKLTEGLVIFGTGSLVFDTEKKPIINAKYLKNTENVFRTINRKGLNLKQKCLCNLKYFIWPKVNQFIQQPRLSQTIINTKIGVVNSIYFLGYWQYPFQTTKRADLSIDHSSQESRTPTFMKATGEMAYEQNTKLNALMVSVPFNKSDYSMLIIISRKISRIEEIEEQLKDIDLLKVARDKKKNFELVMPGFEFNFEMELNEFLFNEMSITGIFENWRDFSNLSNKKLFVQSINHKTRIAVTPTKMEVASVNVVQFDESPKGAAKSSEFEQEYWLVRSRNNGAEEVKLDKPFYFAVRNKEKVFFVGTIKDFKNII
ncbi:antitrypsin-like [Scaptodrosophila lebanonensis]|uniref:Antitrypsin-like n=1 Tax=Drosophila lebanonensis TaxID=7225 RepID=A0A6J2TRG3_DROLE|nr:antitrypsin-like [Scaptodrosophila lebanonensis]